MRRENAGKHAEIPIINQTVGASAAADEEFVTFETREEKDAALSELLRRMAAQLRQMLLARSNKLGTSNESDLSAAWDEFEEVVDDTRIRLAGRELVSPERVRVAFPSATTQGVRGPDFMAMIMSEERSISKQHP